MANIYGLAYKRLDVNHPSANHIESNTIVLGAGAVCPYEAALFVVDMIGIESNRTLAFRQAAEQIYTTALDRKSTRLNSSHTDISRMPSSA